MHRRRLATLLPLLLAGQAAAQAPDTYVAEYGGGRATRPELRAVPLASDIHLDGRLDEEAWTLAQATSDFTQMAPREGAAPTERTEVRVLVGSDALYVGARMYDSGRVTSRLSRRDSNMSDSDRFAISLDTYHDHLNAFRFEVNPSGVKNDALRAVGMDPSWNAVWDVATRVDSLGWTAEFRIPLSQLRFPAGGGEQTWGLQFSRIVARTHEHSVLAYTPTSERGGVAAYGHLTGLQGLRPGRRFELLPYLTASAASRPVDAEDPFRGGSSRSAGLGMDVRYGVTSNLTLNATVNPDFGQVELDPAQINLSAYETYYQERRPFFVEGANVFDFGGDGGAQLFYSRRIGARPLLSVDDAIPDGDAAYSDVPQATTILGAAKLTGKTADGWSLGVLNAITAREEAAYLTEGGTLGRAAVEPASNYFVGRAMREMREGSTTVGGLMTAVVRDLSTPEMAGALRSRAYVAGTDFRHEWASRRWSLSGALAGSVVRGEAPAILRAQESSARYYQRPDARAARLDSAATALSGYAANLSLDREAGLHWRGGLSARTTSPGFEVNDLGFLSRVDRVETDGYLVYVENRPGRVFRDWRLNAGAGRDWNYDGNPLGLGVSLGGWGTLRNYWGGGFGVNHNAAALDDRFTRGGPLVRMPAGSSGYFNVHSDNRQPVTTSGSANYWRDAVGSWRRGAGLSVGLKPASNWEVGLGPNLSRAHYNAQYVTEQDDPLAVHTFGTRYLYADFDQTTLGLGTRLNVTFSPEMTLELYAQPYVSVADYGTLKELSAPRTFRFTRYGIDAGTVEREDHDSYLVDPDGPGPAPAFSVDERDFDYRSLRGNAVLRWEFRPGSTLFLVWQQQRSGYLDAASAAPGSLGRFDLARDARGMLALAPENVFMLKVNYWINP